MNRIPARFRSSWDPDSMIWDSGVPSSHRDQHATRLMDYVRHEDAGIAEYAAANGSVFGLQAGSVLGDPGLQLGDERLTSRPGTSMPTTARGRSRGGQQRLTRPGILHLDGHLAPSAQTAWCTW